MSLNVANVYMAKLPRSSAMIRRKFGFFGAFSDPPIQMSNTFQMWLEVERTGAFMPVGKLCREVIICDQLKS